MLKTFVLRSLVRACYRVLLQRDPDDAKVVNDIARRASGQSDVLRHFVDSTEFKALSGFDDMSDHLAYNQTYQNGKIDISVAPDVLEQMLNRIQKQWQTLGETEPHWSVLTQND